MSASEFDLRAAEIATDPYLGIEQLPALASTGDPRVADFLAGLVERTDPFRGTHFGYLFQEAVRLLGLHGNAQHCATIRARLGARLFDSGEISEVAIDSLFRLGDRSIYDDLCAAILAPPSMEPDDAATLPWLVKSVVARSPAGTDPRALFEQAAASRKKLTKAAGIFGLACLGVASEVQLQHLLRSTDVRLVAAGLQACAGAPVAPLPLAPLIRHLPSRLSRSAMGVCTFLFEAGIPCGDVLVSLLDDPEFYTPTGREPDALKVYVLENAYAKGSPAASAELDRLIASAVDPDLRTFWMATRASTTAAPEWLELFMEPVRNNRDFSGDRPSTGGEGFLQTACVRALAKVAGHDLRRYIDLLDFLHDVRREKFPNRAYRTANAVVIAFGGPGLYREYPAWRESVIAGTSIGRTHRGGASA